MRGFLGWVFECVARVHGRIITRPGISLGARQEWLLPSQTKPEEDDSSGRQEAPGATSARLPAFSHPDCTVGPGITPAHAPEALAGCTAGRDLGPAALTLPRRRGFQLANSTPVRRNHGRGGGPCVRPATVRDWRPEEAEESRTPLGALQETLSAPAQPAKADSLATSPAGCYPRCHRARSRSGWSLDGSLSL